jgi:hypothetical protein
VLSGQKNFPTSDNHLCITSPRVLGSGSGLASRAQVFLGSCGDRILVGSARPATPITGSGRRAPESATAYDIGVLEAIRDCARSHGPPDPRRVGV